MKVQKIISLDEETSKLAAEMENFSKFVRDCLRNNTEYQEINREILTRIKWKRTSEMVAQALLDVYEELEIEHDKTVESIVMKAFNQTRLEDF